MSRAPGLSRGMTEDEFDRGYWYAMQLKAFAKELGVQNAATLRKDQLEKLIRGYIRTGKLAGNVVLLPETLLGRRPQIPAFACVLPALRCSRTHVRSAPLLAENCGKNRALRTGVLKSLAVVVATRNETGAKDHERGLRAELPVENYTNNKETKEFLLKEARKHEPNFKPKSGTRYLLNRWREEQLAAGNRITYGDLAQRAIALNREKTGPLRLEHSRYMNFISDYRSARPKASHSEAVAAWHEVKASDVPKTYEAWLMLQTET